jgi:hypothetical protein
MSRRGDIGPPGAPDIEVGASAKANRLRFAKVPDARVAFVGEDSVSHTERKNLPEEVEPRVEYRDVEVAWVGAAVIAVTSQVPGQAPARNRYPQQRRAAPKVGARPRP